LPFQGDCVKQKIEHPKEQLPLYALHFAGTESCFQLGYSDIKMDGGGRGYCCAAAGFIRGQARFGQKCHLWAITWAIFMIARRMAGAVDYRG
jgi:hypothetical protein